METHRRAAPGKLRAGHTLRLRGANQGAPILSLWGAFCDGAWGRSGAIADSIPLGQGPCDSSYRTWTSPRATREHRRGGGKASKNSEQGGGGRWAQPRKGPEAARPRGFQPVRSQVCSLLPQAASGYTGWKGVSKTAPSRQGNWDQANTKERVEDAGSGSSDAGPQDWPTTAVAGSPARSLPPLLWTPDPGPAWNGAWSQPLAPPPGFHQLARVTEGRQGRGQVVTRPRHWWASALSPAGELHTAGRQPLSAAHARHATQGSDG